MAINEIKIVIHRGNQIDALPLFTSNVVVKNMFFYAYSLKPGCAA